MLWLDYRKAYDSVPHSWILECLGLLKAHPSLSFFTASNDILEDRIDALILELLISTVGFSRVTASHLYCFINPT